MQIFNKTPFAFANIMGRVNFPSHTTTLIVKAGFRLVHGANLEPLPGPIQFEGDVPSAAERPECLYPADFAQFKPKADLLLRAACHTPGQKGVTACTVKFSVGGWSKELAVIGNRHWDKGLVFSKMSDPEPFTRVDLTWANAFGGEKFALNPAGKGRKDGLLPNVEYPDELVKSAGNQPTPASFGPIDRTWKQRASKMGTYDKKWLKERFPAFAKDFDWTHFNAAPEDQQLDSFLRGDERVELLNMHPRHPVLQLQLPRLRVRCIAREGDELAPREVQMNLDTLFIDAEKEELYLTWRGIHNVGDDEWSACRDLLVISEPLASTPADVSELLPLFADPLDEEEVAAETEAPQSQEQALAEFNADVAATEKEVEALQQKGAAFMKSAVQGVVSQAMSQAASAPPVQPAQIPALLSGSIARLVKEAGDQALKAPKEAAAQLKALIAKTNDPAFKQLMDQAAKEGSAEEPAPASKQGAVAMAKSGEAQGGDFSNADLSGEDLSGADLREAVFRGANLKGTKLSGANLAHANFTGADLSEAALDGADLTGADFTDAKLASADLTGANLEDAGFANAGAAGARLKDAKAAGVDFDMVDFSGADFAGADLKGSVFFQCKLAGALFNSASLAGTSMDSCDASGADFTGADMSNFRAGMKSVFDAAKLPGIKGEQSVWDGVSAKGADFGESKLSGAQFPHCDLSGARLYACDLAGAMLRKANLRDAQGGDANFFQALLEQADLSGASLVASNFYEAELMEAVTEGTNFEGANLRNTKLA
ncbi:MAG: DUF2169 domain-containing protein [Planctomycetota bacterium]|nr:DUF2169 domain-containing protein [Planctomycetota bacterium]